MNLSSLEYNLLYSVYSFPNIVLPILAGSFVDRLGNRLGITVFSFILIVGQGLCAFGAWMNNYYYVLAGRVVYGLGGEALNVAQSAMASSWFKGSELAFAISLIVSVSRGGSIIASASLVNIYNFFDNSLAMPLFVGFLTLIFSFLMGQLMIRDQEEGLNLSKIFKFSYLQWLICFSCLLNYQGIFPFLQNFQGYLVARYGIDQNWQYIGFLISLPYFISIVFSPIFGLMIDKFQKRCWIIIFAAVALTAAHSYLIIVPDCPDASCSWMQVLPSQLGLGIMYSVYASVIWACVPLVCNPDVVGIAFGVITSVQNLGLTTFPIIVSQIQTNTSSVKDGYFYQQIFLIGVGGACFLIAILIYIEDIKTGLRLNGNPKKNKLIEIEDDTKDKVQM